MDITSYYNELTLHIPQFNETILRKQIKRQNKIGYSIRDTTYEPPIKRKQTHIYITTLKTTQHTGTRAIIHGLENIIAASKIHDTSHAATNDTA